MRRGRAPARWGCGVARSADAGWAVLRLLAVCAQRAIVEADTPDREPVWHSRPRLCRICAGAGRSTEEKDLISGVSCLPHGSSLGGRGVCNREHG